MNYHEYKIIRNIQKKIYERKRSIFLIFTKLYEQSSKIIFLATK